MNPDPVDWSRWLRRWDDQQALYMQDRERRFAAMFDALAATGPVRRVIDLASGPGSLTARLLARFPGARSVLIDFDPVLLRLGRESLAPLRDRTTWVEADLRSGGWSRLVPPGAYDAVLSTTALHWLTERELTRVYRTVHALLRPGGLFLDGDHVPFERTQPQLRAIARSVSTARRAGRAASGPTESWNAWWSGLEREPALRSEFLERRRRYPHAGHGEAEVGLARRATLLRAAGFGEVGTVYQEFDDRVVVAIRRGRRPRPRRASAEGRPRSAPRRRSSPD